MSKFIEGKDRSQETLFSERLDGYVEAESPVRLSDIVAVRKGVLADITGTGPIAAAMRFTELSTCATR